MGGWGRIGGRGLSGVIVSRARSSYINTSELSSRNVGYVREMKIRRESCDSQ